MTFLGLRHISIDLTILPIKACKMQLAQDFKPTDHSQYTIFVILLLEYADFSHERNNNINGYTWLLVSTEWSIKSYNTSKY